MYSFCVGDVQEKYHVSRSIWCRIIASYTDCAPFIVFKHIAYIVEVSYIACGASSFYRFEDSEENVAHVLIMLWRCARHTFHDRRSIRCRIVVLWTLHIVLKMLYSQACVIFESNSSFIYALMCIKLCTYMHTLWRCARHNWHVRCSIHYRIMALWTLHIFRIYIARHA